MTLLLDLTPEQEGRLRQVAAEVGQPLDQYANELFDKALSAFAPPRPFYETATQEEWLAAFQKWVHSHDQSVPVLLNDSREVIYED